jgi:UDP-hydrolysing UDP-N-acetyl-D-glucosamine 2-epimerase
MAAKRVAVVLTARASWAKLETVVRELVERDTYPIIYACGAALLPQYGEVVRQVRARYPELVVVEVWSQMAGNAPVAAAKSAGALVGELAALWTTHRPDVAVVMADRYEVLAAAQAAAYLNIPLVHIQGGERSGNIDDKVRDAITHLADVHCVTTPRAAARVYGMTGVYHAIHRTGCPSIDLAKAALYEPWVTAKELSGAGDPVDPLEPFTLMLLHPDTTQWQQSYTLATTVLYALRPPVLIQWPNSDPGHELVAKAIRVWMDKHQGEGYRTIPNLAPTRFLRLLSQARVLVGNSSAGIREASYLGTPVVNVGNRQQGRERAANVLDVPGTEESEAVCAAWETQWQTATYGSSSLYGDGTAGARIAEVICG